LGKITIDKEKIFERQQSIYKKFRNFTNRAGHSGIYVIVFILPDFGKASMPQGLLWPYCHLLSFCPKL